MVSSNECSAVDNTPGTSQCARTKLTIEDSKLNLGESNNDWDLVGLSVVLNDETSSSSPCIAPLGASALHTFLKQRTTTRRAGLNSKLCVDTSQANDLLETISIGNNLPLELNEDYSKDCTETSYLSSSDEEDDSSIKSCRAMPDRGPGRPPLWRSSKSLSNIMSGSSPKQPRRKKWGRLASPPITPPGRKDTFMSLLNVPSWNRYPRVPLSPTMPSLAPTSSFSTGSFDSDSDFDDDDYK